MSVKPLPFQRHNSEPRSLIPHASTATWIECSGARTGDSSPISGTTALNRLHLPVIHQDSTFSVHSGHPLSLQVLVPRPSVPYSNIHSPLKSQVHFSPQIPPSQATYHSDPPPPAGISLISHLRRPLLPIIHLLLIFAYLSLPPGQASYPANRFLVNPDRLCISSSYILDTGTCNGSHWSSQR